MVKYSVYVTISGLGPREFRPEIQGRRAPHQKNSTIHKWVDIHIYAEH